LADLAARVVEQVPDGAVTDLYAGVGLFAVSLATHGRRDITAVEGDRSSARDLETNAAPHAPAVHVVHASVEDYLERARRDAAQTVVVDPPRTGISREAMSGLLALKAPRVVYVSCDPPTLARDMRRFREVGYQLRHIEAFDLFPNTPHVETLAVLTR
jgi:tRNA/tmRNA/rRNA uracil-C5-methylase (TrmA/RlmC/RlmD family)